MQISSFLQTPRSSWSQRNTALKCLLPTIRGEFIRKVQKRQLVWSQGGLPEEGFINGVVPEADSELRCQERRTG